MSRIHPMIHDGGRFSVTIIFRAERDYQLDAERIRERYPALYNTPSDVFRKAVAIGLEELCRTAQIPSALTILQAAQLAEEAEATTRTADRLIGATFHDASEALKTNPQKARRIVDRTRARIQTIPDPEWREELTEQFDSKMRTLALPVTPPPKVKIRGISLKPSDAVLE